MVERFKNLDNDYDNDYANLENGLTLAGRMRRNPPGRTAPMTRYRLRPCLSVAALAICAILLVLPATASAQGRGGGVYRMQVDANWFDGGDRFWYRNDLHEGRREFILVDAVRGERRPAFDHQRLAEALRARGIAACAERLPIDDLRFDTAANMLAFTAGDAAWTVNLVDYTLTPGAADSDEALEPLAQLPDDYYTAEPTSITFINRTPWPLEIFWLASETERQSYGTVAPGEQFEQSTYAGHVWELVAPDGRSLGIYRAEAQPSSAIVREDAARGTRGGQGRGARGGFAGGRGPETTSPDGRWRAEVRDHNVFIVDTESGEAIGLTDDGTADHHYGRLSWSPDSRALAAFRIRPVETRVVYTLQNSLPADVFASRLTEQRYPLPGDEFTKYEPNVFNIEERRHIRPDVEIIDFGTPQWRWRDGHKVTYEKVDRGHQRFRIVEIDALTGEARNIIDERAETFIWTAHMDVMNFPKVHWLEQTDEIIFTSEMDGWRHLFLVDVPTGRIVNTVTPGEYVVREVDRVDEEKRQIWFRASGMNPDQDPYFIHYYRINFDGTGLVALTEGDGTHAIEYSPDRRFIIDTYSRVDLPPVHELRRVEDGALVCELERADVSHIDWRPPTVFVARGRDDVTDIWGIIEFPENLDPDRKYPILEDIYAGPQGSFVPKSFSLRPRYESWTDLGFIVVKIDGMGMANRSKAFHDVCWKNLKDAGFPDRIRWIRAAAEQYPFMDLERVGIFGTSAGGQNAAAAVLFHGDFYKVAVASCGCHDNRMDKASWNEQWMGYPVGPQYSESSNIDNAHRLRGRLMLIVGEMDNNVPPASTYKFADALIKAGKDFELVSVPGAGHGGGGPHGNRKRVDFFVRHLLGEDPPNYNAE